MNSRIVQTTEAVVRELNSCAFSLPFTAQRHYQPGYELQDLQGLHISVVPRGIATYLLDRSHSQHEIQIDIAVQKKFSSGSLEELDPLMTLVQEIADHFERLQLSDVGAFWVKTENKPIYAQEHMQEFRLFTSVLTITFKVTE